MYVKVRRSWVGPLTTKEAKPVSRSAVKVRALLHVQLYTDTAHKLQMSELDVFSPRPEGTRKLRARRPRPSPYWYW